MNRYEIAIDRVVTDDVPHADATHIRTLASLASHAGVTFTRYAIVDRSFATVTIAFDATRDAFDAYARTYDLP